MRLGHQRPHVVAVIAARADFHIGDFGTESLHHRIGCGVAHRHHQRHGHAALSARAVGCAHQCVDRVRDVGVGHDHRVVLCATECCTRLPCALPVVYTYSAIGVEPTNLTAFTRGSVSKVSTASLSNTYLSICASKWTCEQGRFQAVIASSSQASAVLGTIAPLPHPLPVAHASGVFGLRGRHPTTLRDDRSAGTWRRARPYAHDRCCRLGCSLGRAAPWRSGSAMPHGASRAERQLCAAVA